LVETIVTLMLLAMIMAGAIKLISVATRVTQAARHRYVAATLAKNRLERARNFQYGDLPLLAENAVVVDDNGVPNLNGWFSRSTQVDTNYITVAGGSSVTNTKVTTTVKIKNVFTGQFSSGSNTDEKVESIFTSYYVPS